MSPPGQVCTPILFLCSSENRSITALLRSMKDLNTCFDGSSLSDSLPSVKSLDGVGGEAGLGLLSVADDGGSGLLESVDGVPDGRVVQLPELLFGAPALIEFPDTAQELRRSRNAADWLGGYGHGSHSPSGSGSAPRQPRFLARGYLHHGWGRHVRQGTDVVPGKVEHGSLGDEQFELLV